MWYHCRRRSGTSWLCVVMLVMMSRKVDDAAASEESAPTSWQLSFTALCLQHRISRISVACIEPMVTHRNLFGHLLIATGDRSLHALVWYLARQLWWLTSRVLQSFQQRNYKTLDDVKPQICILVYPYKADLAARHDSAPSTG